MCSVLVLSVWMCGGGVLRCSKSKEKGNCQLYNSNKVGFVNKEVEGVMLTPRSEAEVTSEWLLHVLHSYERRKTSDEVTLQITDFEINKGSKPGEGFNSELINVVIKVKKQIKNECEEIVYDLMLKLHRQNLSTKEMYRFLQSHIREMLIYSTIQPKLTELQNELGLDQLYELNIPELIYSLNDGDDFAIVMRNLKSVGYILNDKILGLNVHQLKLAVNQIARWHALSFVYNEQFDMVKEFPYFLKGAENFELSVYVVEFVIQSLYSLFKGRDDWKDFFSRLKNKKEILKKIRKNVIPSKTKIPNTVYCLIHGDFWNNNLLYKYKNDTQIQERHPVDISIIDWQMCHWNRAVIDLHYLLQTSTTYEVRKEHLDDILKEYYETFYEITNKCSTPITGLTYESFKIDFEESSIVGFCYGLCLSLGTLSKAGEKVNRPSSDSVNVRGVSYTIKSTVIRQFVPLLLNPSMSFMARAAIKQMMSGVKKEVEENCNEVMNKRLIDLIQEAIEKGTLNDINPV